MYMYDIILYVLFPGCGDKRCSGNSKSLHFRKYQNKQGIKTKVRSSAKLLLLYELPVYIIKYICNFS